MGFLSFFVQRIIGGTPKKGFALDGEDSREVDGVEISFFEISGIFEIDQAGTVFCGEASHCGRNLLLVHFWRPVFRVIRICMSGNFDIPETF